MTEDFKFKKIKNSAAFLTLTLTMLLLVVLPNSRAYSQTANELQQKIDSHNEKIKQLDAEIQAYQKQIDQVGNDAQNLQNAIKSLDINRQKIAAEIKKTQTSIDKTNLTIQELGGQISNAEVKINSNLEIIKKTVREMNQNDDKSLIENFLESKSLAEIFDEYEFANQFQEKIREQSKNLALHKEELSQRKTSSEEEKKKLVALKSDLNDQNQILNINKKEKSDLLAATKNKESEYKKILATRQAEREQFEKELFQFESQLKIAIDPNSFPAPGSKVFSYPLDNVLITQAFGKTVDSKRLYVSGTHNGVDFRASPGTPVKAVLNGIVQGTGNTDEQPGCYSYGKWVLIKHPNGLSSLYAHLSLIKVGSGQSVSTGDTIGYSGQTGYATGPHLHLTIYASQGVEIQRYTSSLHCKNVDIPIADSKAYLDPMLYF